MVSGRCNLFANLLVLIRLTRPLHSGKHVVFGEVTEGMDLVKKIEGYGSDSGSESLIPWITAVFPHAQSHPLDVAWTVGGKPLTQLYFLVPTEPKAQVVISASGAL